MAKWNKLIITDAGYQLSAQTLAEKKIQYTHAETTDKDLSEMTVDGLKAMTKIESVVQDLPVGTVSVQDDHTINVPVKVTNQDVTTDYLLYGLALFAKPDDGEEILYGILTATKPDLIPAQTGATVTGTNFKLKVHVGDAANVNIVVSPDGSVSNDELEGILKQYVLISDLSEKLPADLAETKKANIFEEIQTFTGGAKDGSGNTFVTENDDNKVVHTADMRKPANQVASIDEVNAKQDKLDYTPANDANVVHRNPNTGTVSESVTFTDLKLGDGQQAASIDIASSQQEAIDKANKFTASGIVIY